MSIAAACRSRGIAACNGVDDDEPCEVGTLHARSADLAIAFAAVIEESSDSTLVERVASSLDALLVELANATAGKPRVS